MINLLYPENYEPNGKILGEKAIESLELKYIAKLICPYNTDFALKVLVELVTDESVIKWRQDILEDFINVPHLETLLYNSIHTIYEGSMSVFAKTGSTQSFFELNDNISQMEAFVECMEKCHQFAVEYGDRIKSAGVKKVLQEIESNYNSDDFNKITSEIKELKSSLANDIKSVTIGINMDKLMRPAEVMLLSVSDEPIRRKTMFERLFRNDKKAEPLSEIYIRKYKDGQVVEVDKKLFYSWLYNSLRSRKKITAVTCSMITQIRYNELRQRDFPNRRAALRRSHHQLCGCISVNILNSLNRVPDGQNSFFKVDVFPFQRTKLTYTDTSCRR